MHVYGKPYLRDIVATLAYKFLFKWLLYIICKFVIHFGNSTNDFFTRQYTLCRTNETGKYRKNSYVMWYNLLLYILEFFQMLMMLLILWPLCFWHGQLGTFINFKVDIRCHKSSWTQNFVNKEPTNNNSSHGIE